MKNIPGVLLTLLLCSAVSLLQAADDTPTTADLTTTAENLLEIIRYPKAPTEPTRVVTALQNYNHALRQFQAAPIVQATFMDQAKLTSLAAAALASGTSSGSELAESLTQVPTLPPFDLTVLLIGAIPYVIAGYYKEHQEELQGTHGFGAAITETITQMDALLSLLGGQMRPVPYAEQPTEEDSSSQPQPAEIVSWYAGLYSTLPSLQDIANSVLRRIPWGGREEEPTTR